MLIALASIMFFGFDVPVDTVDSHVLPLALVRAHARRRLAACLVLCTPTKFNRFFPSLNHF